MQKLDEFCINMKQFNNTDIDKLNRFYGCYKDRMKDWKGKLDVNQLYTRFN